MDAPCQPEPLSGTLRGDVAALDAAARDVRVWCGVALGWRRFGARRGSSTVPIGVDRRPAPIVPGGVLRGNVAGLDAAARRIEVWCGPPVGWRHFGAPIGTTSTLIVVQWGRASAGRRWALGETPWGMAHAACSWDLGGARFPRRGDGA